MKQMFTILESARLQGKLQGFVCIEDIIKMIFSNRYINYKLCWVPISTEYCEWKYEIEKVPF